MSMKLDHSDSFTSREIKTIEFWELAVQASDAANAHAILMTGLRAEHFESLLPDDPSQRSVEDIAQLLQLSQDADAAIAKFQAGQSQSTESVGHDRG